MAKKKSPAAKPQESPIAVATQSAPSAPTSASPAAVPSPAPPSSLAATSLRALQAAGLQSLTQLMDAWNARHRRPPAKLYHYTNAQGLHGMLSTGRVWGTNVGFLNDPSEMRYAARLIRNVVEEETKALDEEAERGKKETKVVEEAPKQLEAGQQPVLKKTSPWESIREKMRNGAWLRPMVEKFANQTSIQWTTLTESLLQTFEDQGDAYMSCFCTKGDLLSQWRGYGATGGGYALGFDARQIGTSVPAGGALLRRVIYNPKDQQKIVREWVRTFLALGRTLAQAEREEFDKAPNTPIELAFGRKSLTGAIRGKESNRQILEQARQELTKFLAQCLICFKDPAYQEEQEWRVIQYGQNAPPIKFRASGPRLVPYVELALMPPTDDGAPVRLPLTSITYGPTLEPAVTEKSLAMLLKHYDYVEPIEIKQSGIPFRT